MAYFSKAHWEVGWGRALANHQDAATCVTTLLLCVGKGSERGLCGCLISGVLPGRKLSPSTRSVASHFNFSQYATDALPAVALALNPEEGEFS